MKNKKVIVGLVLIFVLFLVGIGVLEFSFFRW